MASFVAVIGIIFYVKYQDEQIPQYYPPSSPKPSQSVNTEEPTVRGRFDDLEVTTTYESQTFKHELPTTEDSSSLYTTNSLYTTTDEYVESDDLFTSTTEDHTIRPDWLNQRQYTTTEIPESTEQIDNLPNTPTEQNEADDNKHATFLTTEDYYSMAYVPPESEESYYYDEA